jgi:hypothetical protein
MRIVIWHHRILSGVVSYRRQDTLPSPYGVSFSLPALLRFRLYLW